MNRAVGQAGVGEFYRAGGWREAMTVWDGHQKRLVRVVCDGLLHSWTSIPPGTEDRTEVTEIGRASCRERV